MALYPHISVGIQKQAFVLREGEMPVSGRSSQLLMRWNSDLQLQKCFCSLVSSQCQVRETARKITSSIHWILMSCGWVLLNCWSSPANFIDFHYTVQKVV